MPDKSDKIKTILEELSTSELPPSARLIAVLFELGIEAPADIEKLTGLRSAGARKAKKQLAEHRHSGSATQVARYSSSATPVATATQVAHSSSDQPSRAHAYKESSSKIVIKERKKEERKEEVARARGEPLADEIEGLNGSTSVYVEMLGRWLAGSEISGRLPDLETARVLLRENCKIYGPDKVRAGMIELKTRIAAGDRINPATALHGFIRNARLEARPLANKKPERINGLELLKERARAKAAAEAAAAEAA